MIGEFVIIFFILYRILRVIFYWSEKGVFGIRKLGVGFSWEVLFVIVFCFLVVDGGIVRGWCIVF